jgi:hypothetical protein
VITGEDIATKASKKSMEEIEIKKISEPRKILESSNQMTPSNNSR